MKKIVSISLGSSKRDHSVKTSFMGVDFHISRFGTDGNFKTAMARLKELDGNVDAIGLGGIDIYLYSKNNRYALRDGLRLKEAVKKSRVVDGSGLKNTLERETIRYLSEKTGIEFKNKKTLMVCAMDRFGMATALVEAGCNVTFGDMMFTLDLNKPIYTLEDLEIEADKILPDVSKLPISMIYPVGKKQDMEPEDKFREYYDEAYIIAGDYHFIRKFMPSDMAGKVIITNTITPKDIDELRKRDVSTLVTTTPEIEGRSFGTNVLEAVMLVLLNKEWEDVTAEDYLTLIKDLDLKPRIETL